jgi:hypothetical protein
MYNTWVTLALSLATEAYIHFLLTIEWLKCDVADENSLRFSSIGTIAMRMWSWKQQHFDVHVYKSQTSWREFEPTTLCSRGRGDDHAALEFKSQAGATNLIPRLQH